MEYINWKNKIICLNNYAEVFLNPHIPFSPLAHISQNPVKHKSEQSEKRS